jgi:hypothetical protein
MSEELVGATKASVHPLDGAGRGAKLNAIIGYIKHLEGQIGTLRVQNAEMQKKIEFEHRQTMQIFSFLGDVETRLEAFRALLTIPRRWLSKKPVFEDEEYDAMWDQIKGIRVRTAGEFVQKGDFVRISYEAHEAGKLINKEDGFPLRVGAGTLFIEDEIIGKPVGLKGHSFVKTYPKDYAPNPNLAGKTVTFTLTIAKVKTRKEEINGDEGSSQFDHHDS